MLDGLALDCVQMQDFSRGNTDNKHHKIELHNSSTSPSAMLSSVLAEFFELNRTYTANV